MKALHDLVGGVLLVAAMAVTMWVMHQWAAPLLAHMHLGLLPIGRWG